MLRPPAQLTNLCLRGSHKRRAYGFSRHNQDYHNQLIENFRSQDREAIGRIMRDHMDQAACHMEVLADDVKYMNLLTR